MHVAFFVPCFVVVVFVVVLFVVCCCCLIHPNYVMTIIMHIHNDFCYWHRFLSFGICAQMQLISFFDCNWTGSVIQSFNRIRYVCNVFILILFTQC